MLNVFEPCTLQIGDRNLYTLKEEDVILLKPDWKRLEKESLNIPVSNPRKGRGVQMLKVGSQKVKRRTPSRNSDSESKADDGKPVEEPNSGKKEDDSDQFESMSSSDDSFVSVSSHGSSNSAAGRSNCLPKPKAVKKSKIAKTRPLKGRKHNSRSHNFNKSAGGPIGFNLQPGDQVVVETICTKSEAEVIWQDGVVEKGISSNELFPIHHLDDQEFFCGDFVVRDMGSTSLDGQKVNPQDYGVIYEADHAGRTCKVKWFRTYTSGKEPK